MIGYVDGFVLAVPEGSLERYREIARIAAEVFREHGALEVVEAVADDVPVGELTSFPRAVLREDGETVVFAWITYSSREHRDEVQRKVEQDPRMTAMRDEAPIFDGKRMIFGGFRPILAL